MKLFEFVSRAAPSYPVQDERRFMVNGESADSFLIVSLNIFLLNESNLNQFSLKSISTFIFIVWSSRQIVALGAEHSWRRGMCGKAWFGRMISRSWRWQRRLDRSDSSRCVGSSDWRHLLTPPFAKSENEKSSCINTKNELSIIWKIIRYF